jgi:hypothetical protein
LGLQKIVIEAKSKAEALPYKKTKNVRDKPGRYKLALSFYGLKIVAPDF